MWAIQLLPTHILAFLRAVREKNTFTLHVTVEKSLQWWHVTLYHILHLYDIHNSKVLSLCIHFNAFQVNLG